MNNVCISVCLIILSISGTITAQFTPYYKKADTIMADGNFLGINDEFFFGSPCLADWDSDGKTDMLLGYWNFDVTNAPGRVCLFKNTGITGAPVFTKVGDLKAAGSYIDLTGA